MDMMGTAVNNKQEASVADNNILNVADIALEVATEIPEEAIGAAAEVAEAVGDGAETVANVASEASEGIGEFIGGLFDSDDALPITLVIGAGAAVIGGLGFGVYKIIKHFKK